ncbi:hypothetical protein ABZ319_17560 [Nocardia sp. NPDC005978]|uniref:hypothetical protein n=1 Tax=Nocardia sp. NPDC005978 TaxID=3156725 RepID=UPI0033A8C308
MCTDGHRCEHCPARRVAGGARVVAQALPALGMVVTATANAAALLSHTGEYLPPAFPGEALSCGADRIALRLHPGRITDIHLTPRALTLADASGTHRAYFTPRSDPMLIEAIALAPAAPPEPETPLRWSELDWRDTDQITHLDALTTERYHVLPFTGARRVEPRVLPHLLTHLADLSLPFTVAVPGGGCLQLHRDRAALVEHEPDHVSVVFGAARYAVSPLHIRECWLTHSHGPTGVTSALELYDHDNRCVTVLTQTGSICPHLHGAWEAIAASLPDPGA